MVGEKAGVENKVEEEAAIWRGLDAWIMRIWRR